VKASFWLEKELVQKAREKRKKADWLEYKLLFQMIETQIEAGLTYSFEEFGQLALRLWTPFKAEVDGYRINVTEQDAQQV
jgi:hypothetical protein